MSGAPTIGAALDAAARMLAAAGVPAARREAQVLLGHALGAGREVVLGHPERPITRDQRDALDIVVERRRAREPTAYILGGDIQTLVDELTSYFETERLKQELSAETA